MLIEFIYTIAFLCVKSSNNTQFIAKFNDSFLQILYEEKLQMMIEIV